MHLIGVHSNAGFAGEKYSEIKPFFPSVATLAVLGIVFVAMALKARSIINHPVSILGMVLPLILLSRQLCPKLAGRATLIPARRRDRPGLRFGDAQPLGRPGDIDGRLWTGRGRDRADHRRGLCDPGASGRLVRHLADKLFGVAPREAAQSPA